MGSKVLASFKRVSVVVGLFVPATAQFFYSLPAPADPGSNPTSLMAGQVLPLERLNLLREQLSVAPELPPLGNANMVLPSPEEIAPEVHLVIRLSDRRVYVYENSEVQTSFPIAIGREGWETPTGTFAVLQMQPDPVWQNPFTGELIPPGSDNPLGSRWIGFWTDGTNYIGFHGTPNVDSVGQAASHGCIRMYDQDVISLFEMVSVGTPVEVVP